MWPPGLAAFPPGLPLGKQAPGQCRAQLAFLSSFDSITMEPA